MARAIADIKKQMTDVFMQNAKIQAAYGLDTTQSFEDQFSTASLESILFYCVAFGVWFLETLFNTFTADVNTYIANMKPGTLRWYVNRALGFQYGFDLLPESDQFDNSNATDDQITASKIIAYADAVEQADEYGKLSVRIKVAASSGTDLQPITALQLTALNSFFARIKYAGVPLSCTSGNPDSLLENWTVYYDPLILDPQGNRLDGTAQNVVQAAIKQYLQQLPFDGIYVLQYHEEFVKTVNGVVICTIDAALSRYGQLPYGQINRLMTPDAGYLRFLKDEDLVINYVPHAAIN